MKRTAKKLLAAVLALMLQDDIFRFIFPLASCVDFSFQSKPIAECGGFELL